MVFSTGKRDCRLSSISAVYPLSIKETEAQSQATKQEEAETSAREVARGVKTKAGVETVSRTLIITERQEELINHLSCEVPVSSPQRINMCNISPLGDPETTYRHGRSVESGSGRIGVGTQTIFRTGVNSRLRKSVKSRIERRVGDKLLSIVYEK